MHAFSGPVLPGYFVIFSFGQHLQLLSSWLKGSNMQMRALDYSFWHFMTCVHIHVSLSAFHLGSPKCPLANIVYMSIVSDVCSWTAAPVPFLTHPRPTWWRSAYDLSLPCLPLVSRDLFLLSHWRYGRLAHSWTDLMTRSTVINLHGILEFKWQFGPPSRLPFYLMLVYQTISEVLPLWWQQRR